MNEENKKQNDRTILRHDSHVVAKYVKSSFN